MTENTQRDDEIPDRMTAPGHGKPEHQHRNWMNTSVSLDGVVQGAAVEYCISEGWVRRYVGGRLRDIELVYGEVKAWFRETT